MTKNAHNMQPRISHPSLVALRTIIIGLLCIYCCLRVFAQSAGPIQKNSLLKALHRRALTIEQLKQELETNGLDFALDGETERAIRNEARYLKPQAVEELIKIIRADYHPNRRLRVSLFKYTPCEGQFEKFASLLDSKIQALSSTLISKDARSEYTAGLKLVNDEPSSNMSLSEANEYWQKTQSLQILRGICVPKGNETYVISQVYLGDLHGKLEETVRIEFKVDPYEYGKTRDIHSLLLLYSLAKEAQTRGVGKDLIISYLSEAMGIAGQLKDADTSVDAIKAAILNMLEELGASKLQR